jgi:hypothetical protein
MILIFTKIPSSLGIVNANVLRFSQLRQPLPELKSIPCGVSIQ